MRTLTATLATTALLVATAASAADWKPATSTTLDLGSFRDTAETDGVRVVATIASVNSHSDQPPDARRLRCDCFEHLLSSPMRHGLLGES